MCVGASRDTSFRESSQRDGRPTQHKVCMRKNLTKYNFYQDWEFSLRERAIPHDKRLTTGRFSTKIWQFWHKTFRSWKIHSVSHRSCRWPKHRKRLVLVFQPKSHNQPFSRLWRVIQAQRAFESSNQFSVKNHRISFWPKHFTLFKQEKDFNHICRFQLSQLPPCEYF